MFCMSCGKPMEPRLEIHGGVVCCNYGCTRCDRAFHYSKPSKPNMDDRFELCEVYGSWTEFKPRLVLSESQLGRGRQKEATQQRTHARCMLRYCPWCGTRMTYIYERRAKGKSGYIYGCAKPGCHWVFRQTGKYFVLLREVSKDDIGYRMFRRDRCRKRRARSRRRR